MVSGFYAPKIFKSSESVIFPSYSPPEVYNPGAKTGGVPWVVRPSLVSLPDNSALIYGDFTDLGGFGPQQGLAKLEPSGYMVTTFTPDPSTTSTNNADLDHEVRCCVQQPDGNILLAGRFDKVNSQAFPYLARVTPTGELDTAFTTSGGFVGPTGQLAVYTSLYSTTGGAVWGTAASITPAGAAPAYRESTIAGSLNWIKYPQTTGHTYVAGFGPLALNVIGARYETSTTGTKVLGADTLTNDVQLSFTGARVELGLQNPGTSSCR